MTSSPEVGQNLRINLVELNNWRRPMANIVNGLIGPHQAAQATDPTFSFFTFQYTAGKQAIKPDIIAWPYATDVDGAAFDQANLWGVRFNAYNPEFNAVIAVPKTLPIGYTATIDRGGWQCQQSGINVPVDYSSSDLVNWTHNADIFGTPKTQFTIRNGPNLDNVLKNWGPMNYANLAPAGISFSFGSASYGTTAGTTIWLQPVASDHIGFRRIRVRYSSSGLAGLTAALGTVNIGWATVGTSFSGAYPTLPTSVFSHAVTKAELTVDSPTQTHVDIMAPDINAPTVGTRVDWWIWFTWVNTQSPFTNIATTLSPRTDVPFPFDVVGLGDGTSSDWHAPGGYVP